MGFLRKLRCRELSISFPFSLILILRCLSRLGRAPGPACRGRGGVGGGGPEGGRRRGEPTLDPRSSIRIPRHPWARPESTRSGRELEGHARASDTDAGGGGAHYTAVSGTAP